MANGHSARKSSTLGLSAENSAAGLTFDTVVIGSGFGGAAVACRLAQAGESVAVLERGPETPLGQGDWKTTGHGTRRKRHGHFLIDEGQGMSVIRGIGLGGGSLHYFGVRLRVHPQIFERARWPAEITRQVLDPYYDIAGEMLGARPVRPNPVAGMPYRGEKFLEAARACRRCHGRPEWVPLAVHFDPEPRPTPAGVPETRCVFCGDCILGCPPSESFEGDVNARELLTLNYLAVAKNHGTQIFVEHFVQEIRPIGEIGSGEGFEIAFTVGDHEEPAPEDLGPVHTVRARRVVLGAGTLGSTELLLRSRTNFPEISHRLGYGFSGNGDFLYARARDTPFDLQPKSGPLIVAGADFSTENHKIYLEDLGAVPILGAMLGIEKGRVPLRGRYTMRFLAMGDDASNGRMILQDGSVSVEWDGRESLPLYNEMRAAIREMAQQLNGTYADPPNYDPETGDGLLTAHPLGGCSMGDDAKQGVVDPKGEVWGVPGLFVADGAIVPSALGKNPSYTISALAERVAFWMLHGREMNAGDLDAPANR